MNFPPYFLGDVDCIITMEVLPNKVQRLASLLYNANLETNGRVRELLNPGGLKIVATQMQGSSPQSVIDVFGPEIANALESAPYRKNEVQLGGIAAPTRCVTMSEFSDSERGAIISLTLGRRAASQIYEKLFKSNHSC
jgi:hypothetical protein